MTTTTTENQVLGMGIFAKTNDHGENAK